MNNSYIHLTLNHLPVLMPLLGVGITLIGVLLKLRQTQVVGLFVIVGGALATIPTYFSGKFAEPVVQNYPMVTQNSIDLHHQAAWYASLAMAAIGTLAVMLLWNMLYRKMSISRQIFWIFMAMALLGTFMIMRTAHLGGLIRHEEIERGSFF